MTGCSSPPCLLPEMADPAAEDVIRIGGLAIRFLQDRHATGGALDLFEMTVQPGGAMPVPHFHESWEETIYGLSGVSTWRVAGEDIAVQPGQSLFIRRGVVHGFRNDGAAPAGCLCMLTPGALGPAYFREMAAALAEGPPDPARLGAIMRRYGLVPVV